MHDFGNERNENQIEGKNAVMEALKAGRPIDKLYIVRGEADRSIRFIVSKAKDAGAVISEVDRRKLDNMSVTHAHQGVIAVAAAKEYASVEEILSIAEAKGEKPFLIICDEVSDPRNLGAVIRTAEAAGVHGMIIPKRRSAGITAVVEKTSAGAAEHMPVARVANISGTINELKKRGIWVFGASGSGETELWKADFRDSTAIVIGSEGEGMGKLVSESCDYRVFIPMKGKVTSLNASVAAAILMYEAVRQRNGTINHQQ